VTEAHSWTIPDPQRAVSLDGKVSLRIIYFPSIEARTLPTVGYGNALGCDIKQVPVSWTTSGRDVRSVFAYGFNIQASNDGADPVTVAELLVQVRIEYELSADDLGLSEDLEHYIGVSGFMHSWPYVRAEVQSLTTKMGFPMLTLPLMLSGDATRLVRLARAPDQATA
jgi:hypothetical protein